MLERLLQLIAEGRGSLPLPELARRLGVSEAMLGPMIDQLIRLGYLAPVEACCQEGACRFCPQGGTCALRPQARLWTLTEKGKKLVTLQKL